MAYPPDPVKIRTYPYEEGMRCMTCGYWWWNDHGANGAEGWHSLVPIVYADHQELARGVLCPTREAAERSGA